MENIQEDIDLTLKNKKILPTRPNLLFWYEELFKQQFKISERQNIQDLKILEIGSGTSPLKMFYPNIVTSDIMSLDYLDYAFDAHKIHETQFTEGQFDIIILTNVLHHLKSPIVFLNNASKKLSKNGQIIFSEPYFSLLSTIIYKTLHHEPSDFSIERPELGEIKGPLSTANMAMPQMIMEKREDWLNQLSPYYKIDSSKKMFFSALSYFATGGISTKIPFPKSLYPLFFRLDQFLAENFPKFFASFFTMSLQKKSSN